MTVDSNVLKNLLESPIFIAGYPRSGTTLLLSLLDSHPELLVYPKETNFFNKILPLFRCSSEEALENLKQDVSSIPWYAPHLYEHGHKVPQFQAKLQKLFYRLGSSEQALLQALVLSHGCMTTQHNKRYWVEKTPGNEKYAETIFQCFPQAKMIYIVRDPRATFASTRKHKEIIQNKSTNVIPFCVEWATSVQTYLDHSNRENVLAVQYEALVQNPHETLTIVCNFLNINFHDILLRPTIDGIKFSGFSSYTAYKTQFNRIDASSLSKWKDVLSRREISLLNYLLSRYITKFGYEFAPTLPPADVLKFLIPTIRYHLGLNIVTKFPEGIKYHLYNLLIEK